jgi:hypothetical protein
MLDISKKIVTQIQDFLRTAPKNLDLYGQKKTDFTRNRKLPFKKLCKFVSKLLKKVYRQNSIIPLRMDSLVANLLFVKPEKN